MDPKRAVRINIPFTKVDAETGIVEGFSTVEEIDKDGEIVKALGAERAFEKLSAAFEKATGGLSLGPVREMHQPSAVGKMVFWEPRDTEDKKPGIFVSTKIVDDMAKLKAVERVYTGFSISGDPTKKHREKINGKMVTVIDELDLVEISLVDHPACPSAVFTLTKRAGNGTDPIEDIITRAEALMPLQKAGKPPKRQDVNPKEGEREYGDVEFADPTNKKYPIDTEEHIRAAWNYINKPANAAKYPDDGAGVKRRIVAAWKRKIDKDGPPSAEKKDKVATGEVEKQEGRSEASSILPALEALRCVVMAIDGEMWEMLCGGAEDERGDVATLTAAAEKVVEFILGELEEQLRSLTSPEGVVMKEAMAALDKLLGLAKVLTAKQLEKVMGEEDMRSHLKAMHSMGHAMTKATYAMGSGCDAKADNLHPVDGEKDGEKGEKEKVADGDADKGAEPSYDEPDAGGKPGSSPTIDEPEGHTPGKKPSAGEPEGTPIGKVAGAKTNGGQDDSTKAMLAKVLGAVGELTELTKGLGTRVEKVERQPAPIGRAATVQDKTLPGAGAAVAGPEVERQMLQKMIDGEKNPAFKQYLVRKLAASTIKSIHEAGPPR